MGEQAQVISVEEMRKIKEFEQVKRELKSMSKNQLIRLLLELNAAAITYVAMIKKLDEENKALKEGSNA